MTHEVRVVWNEVVGTYKAGLATVKGLGSLEGETEEQFNESLKTALSDEDEILVVYPDHTIILHPHHAQDVAVNGPL